MPNRGFSYVTYYLLISQLIKKCDSFIKRVFINKNESLKLDLKLHTSPTHFLQVYSVMFEFLYSMKHILVLIVRQVCVSCRTNILTLH